MKKLLSILVLSFIVVIALMLAATPACAADDSNLRVSLTNATAAATNTTAAIDLGVASPKVWNLAYLRANIPATANATNSATTLLFTLQDSADNSSWAYTAPLVQLQVAGGSSITNTALSVKMPIPPDVRRYIRVQQISPTASGANTGVTNVYTLAVP